MAMKSRCGVATGRPSPACMRPHSFAIAAGRVRRHQGTLVDITERREIERRLHREQEFARRLVESFPDLVIAADREGRYTFVSPAIPGIARFRSRGNDRHATGSSAWIRAIARKCAPCSTL